MRILHLGCGRKGEELKLSSPNLITLDADERLSPDIVCKLGRDPIPLEDNSVDLAVAVHVLEHIGQQGDPTEWFFFWEEIYRVLVPDGKLEFESPYHTSVWAWADPTHVRPLSPQSFIFFCQDNYRLPGSAISPYRIKCDFHPSGRFEGMKDSDPNLQALEPISHFKGSLIAKKPLNVWWSEGS